MFSPTMSDLTSFLPSKQKILMAPLKIPALNPIPRRYRRSHRHRSRRNRKNSVIDDSSITKLEMSYNPMQSIRELRQRRWKLTDLRHLALFCLTIFSLVITPSAPLLKLAAVLAGSFVLLIPITRQFVAPGLPIWLWLLFYFSSRFIPVEVRPHIWVRVLPALENILYGANLSNILSAHTHPILDIFAWIPYGLLHFGGPFVVSLILFVYSAPGTLPIFAGAFGWMNIVGVIIQLIFPCTPPWYENEHGLVPAAYGMSGSPAGLARVDKILGIDMYTTSFSTGPVPFGAFPSLHSANAVIEALFLSHCFPKLRPMFFMYVGWIWWSTMYLNHHYAVDLVAGALLAAACFYVSRAYWLPRYQPGKAWRWDYEFVERGTRNKTIDEETGVYPLEANPKISNFLFSASPASASHIPGLTSSGSESDSDSWAVGSSSSYSSIEPASGTLSPTLSDEATAPPFNRASSTFTSTAAPNGQISDGNKTLNMNSINHALGAPSESELQSVVIVPQ